MAQARLPARPALELGATTVTETPIVVSASKGVQYALPPDFQNPDLAAQCQPPAALGQFWTQPQPK